MHKFIYIVIALLSMHSVHSQNLTDDQGKKHGKWEVKYKNGKTKYKGQFEHGKPIGFFQRFDSRGTLEAELDYLPDGNVSAKIYHNNGKVSGSGTYRNEKKEGEWKFYTSDGYLSSVEHYKAGEKHGKSEVYYTNGKLSLETHFVEGLETGMHIEYFQSGGVKFKVKYIDGNPDGFAIWHFENGKLNKKGFYRAAVKDGEWTYIETNGVEITVIYDLGREVSRKIDSSNYRAPNRPRY